jgi:hypothetical protein
LTLVSRKVGLIAQDVLYRVIVLDSTYMNSQISTLMRTLLDRPDFAKTVRALDFSVAFCTGADRRPLLEHFRNGDNELEAEYMRKRCFSYIHMRAQLRTSGISGL